MREKITKLFEMTDSADMFRNFVGMMLEQVRMIYGADEPQLVDAIINRANAVVVTEMPRIMEEFVRLYEDTYNENEIDAMLVWHDSPVGRKARAMSKPLQASCMAIGASVGAKIEEEVKQVIREYELSDSSSSLH
jgi:hypothetical protein